MIAQIQAIMAGTAAIEKEVWENRVHWARGCRMQRYRLSRVATLCAERYLGDLVEIGAYIGGTTERLAEVAALHGRRVIVCDPWNPAPHNEYVWFQRNTARHKEYIDVLRAQSQSAAAQAAIAARDLCFAFVDGMHTYEACAPDIEAVSHAPVIAVDDLLAHNMEGVLRAFQEAAEREGWRAITQPYCREGYLVLA